ncbi:uncharacterized protein LOC127836572 [Dreissena polymorpha]|uniref:Uncharacterized protein n=1 Tax=Dreissena polymorpha TaxID=45954 RepID=A0A9D4G5G6_DREPO|nr:uncharacterized protein LOC127836572 [Dreissena polymorpha]KAH3810894.1 hypothetical protein DPMN_139293 [Dreissena polymorpha]
MSHSVKNDTEISEGDLVKAMGPHSRERASSESADKSKSTSRDNGGAKPKGRSSHASVYQTNSSGLQKVASEGTTYAKKDSSNNKNWRKKKAKTTEYAEGKNRPRSTFLYVVLCEDIPNQKLITEYLRQRMGNPKCLEFKIDAIEKMTSNNEGCTLLSISCLSFKQSKRVEGLLNKSNMGSQNKIYCFFNKIKALGENLGSTKMREEKVTKALNEIIEASGRVLNQHDNKIECKQSEILQIDCQLQQKRGVAFDVFEKLSAEKIALSDKLDELYLQRSEFMNYLKSVRSKITVVMDHVNPDGELLEVRKALGVECRRLDAALPMYARREDILTTIMHNQVCVILGETGSGKSTQIVQYLYQAGLSEHGLIACTQPRKIAAISLATHVSKELASSVGQIVGYQVGMQSKKTAITRVLYMTDHILLNECISDKLLSKYCCVVMDEAHERSIHTDLLIGMLKRVLAARQDLRVVVTSATIDPGVFVDYFGGPDKCPVLQVSGRTFPVDICWETDEASDFPDDYERKALNKAIEIHTSEPLDGGDILVFVTSALETSRCVERFKQRCGDKNNICLQLHGRLKPEEQQHVFDPTPTGKRKIVFATNIAETSLTIDGVKFVVDTGLAKEMRFDPKRNMSSLDVTQISQSSANQRKGRAGRTSAGKCYRLYTKNDFFKMETSSTPEILRIEVSHAILKLFQLMSDPLEFDFVQSPSPLAMKAAHEDLIYLEAIDDNGITELGKWIAQLQVEPRLGVMIKKGIDDGIPLEAMIVGTCCNQSVFYRAGTEEEKKAADLKKLEFCHAGGDLITMLCVYREWDAIKEKEKGKWCNSKCINGKSMKGVRDMVNEICTTLKKEMGLKIKHEFTEPISANEKIKALIFDCMHRNLGYYLGHESAGYVITERNQRVQLHPSSVIWPLGLHPTWIVFNRVLKTSNDYITEITPIEQQIIADAKTLGKISVDENKLSSMRVELVPPVLVGKHVFWKFVGPMHKNRRKVQDEIQSVCESTTVIIDAMKQRGEIQLYCIPAYAGIAFDLLNNYLQPLSEQLSFERLEEPIGAENNSVRALLGEGGLVCDILMPTQFRVLNIKQKIGESCDLNEDMLRGLLSTFGPIENIWQSTGQKQNVFWGKVTFTNHSDAERAVNEIQNDVASNFSLIPITFQAHMNVNQHGYTIKLTWCRRKAKGVCYVYVDRPEDLSFLMSNRVNILGNSLLLVPAKQQSDLYIRNLPANVMEEDVAKGLGELLSLSNADTKDRFKIIIPRENIIWRTNELDQTRAELINILQRYTLHDKYDLRVVNYQQKTVTGVAYVTFSDMEECERVFESLMAEHETMNGSRLSAQRECKSFVHIKRHIYGVIQEDIMKQMELVESDASSIEVRQLKSGHYSIDIKSKSLQKLAKVKVKIDRLVNGNVIEQSESTDILPLLTKNGKRKLIDIQQRTKTIICADDRHIRISVQGLEVDRARALELIMNEIQCSSLSNETEIRLKGEDNPPGLMKALILKYGMQFEQLVKESNISCVSLNFRRQEITITGPADAVEKALDLIRDEKNSLPKLQSEDPDPYKVPDCPVCLCPIEETEMCRLEFCGHAYCSRCLSAMLKAAIDSREFPITCATDKCNRPLVARDFKNFMRTNDIKKMNLVNASVNDFARRNKQCYRFCRTPDCPMIYRVNSSENRYDCPLCHAKTCTRCHVEYHDGLTCAMYASAKQDGDSVLRWVKEDPQNRKMCPKCEYGIEKNGGCQHMECVACKAHICWICMKFFKSSRSCYGHLTSAHGSFV